MNFATVMDIAILLLLAATVFIGFRLSVSLRHFRESRFEMEGLLNRLTSNIDSAENAIAGLQNAAKNSGVNLQAIINDSKFLVDELKFMNEAGNSLAGRLEKLAEKNRELVEQVEAAGGIGPQEIHYQRPAPEAARPKIHDVFMDDDSAPLGFMIQDREFDEEAEAEFLLSEADDMMPALQSQAERELFEALSRHKRKNA